MMRILLIFSTILALLGCPLRCAVGQIWEISSVFSETTEGFRALGCSCCSQPTTCDTPSSNPKGSNSNSPTPNPAPDDCDCLCLCKGAIVEKYSELPDLNGLDGFLTLLVVDEPISALQLLEGSSYRNHRLKSSDPRSGRLIRLAVHSLLI